MYSKVYTKLREGGCIGIFPEGGSHDRTDLLPLKAGVSIMALGALAENPNLELHIVPVGLSYFHPHRFRSRAVVEFGEPISLPSELVELFKQGGAQKRDAVGQTLDLVFEGLKTVTVRAPDYETLMVVQACRRLYRPPGQQMSLGAVVELNRRFIAGYLRYKDEPRVQQLRDNVLDYNKALRTLNLRDHQIERVNRPMWKAFVLLVYRTGVLTVWSSLALPGVILNAPMFITASIISRKKAKGAYGDVVAELTPRRSARGVDGQDRRSRRPRHLESARRARHGPAPLRALRRLHRLARLPLPDAARRQAVDADRDVCAPQHGRLLGVALRRERHGRLQVAPTAPALAHSRQRALPRATPDDAPRPHDPARPDDRRVRAADVRGALSLSRSR